MKTWLAAIGACAMLSAHGAAQPPDRCIQRPSKHYGDGLAYYLLKADVPFTFLPDGGVCVTKERAMQIEAAARQVDLYFWEIARPIEDPCEEQALAAWATREHLRFDIADVVDLRRSSAGRVFRLRSYTEEEVASNRRRLEEAPRGVTCPGEDPEKVG